MRILALDLGTVTGWASDISGRLEYGEHDFSLARGESPGMRYHNFNVWLRRMCCPEPFNDVAVSLVDLISYELPHLRGGAAATVLSGLETRVHEFCALHQRRDGHGKVDHEAVHSAILKKFATGKGNADKPAMVAAAERLLQKGYVPASAMGPKIMPPPLGRALTDNEADALWLYWRAKSIRG